MSGASELLRYGHTTSWASAKKRRLVDEPSSPQNLLEKHPGACVDSGFVRPRHAQHESLPRLQVSAISTSVGNLASPSLYTQRKLYPSTPGLTQNPLLSLSHSRYCLPEGLVSNLQSMGISSIYPWQSSCLLGKGNLTGEQNLVYTAPTGGGKSLVADVLMMRRVLDGKKAVLVLPYVSLVQEKLRWLRRALNGVERPLEHDSQEPSHTQPQRSQYHEAIRVAGFFGGAKTRETWADVDLAANSLINAAIQAGSLDDLGIVVIDELHMVDDQHRGYILELLAAKLLSLDQSVQLVGMSATLSDTKLLATWLRAKFYESRYRPIPVEEFLVCDNQIYPVHERTAHDVDVQSRTCDARDAAPCRQIAPSTDIALKSALHNAVVSLAMETVDKGFGTLIFCGSRQACESMALLIARVMPALEEVKAEMQSSRGSAINSLQSLGFVPLDETLAKTIPYGVAFHHAGLTTEEREIVASAFDAGVLKVLVATCSLAAGINLPARRVILQGARMGRELVGPAMLRQMRGRAGRKGKDELGESFVCCRKEELEEVRVLLEADLTPVSSSLTPEKRGVKRALLEVIATRLATHADGVQDFVERTLLYHTQDPTSVSIMIQKALKELEHEAFLELSADSCYEATDLGLATVASGFSPPDGSFLHDELQKAMRAFVLDTDLHVFYTFAPTNSSALEPRQISWPAFRGEIDSFSEADLRVLSFVGVNPAFVNRQANSATAFNLSDAAEADKARIYVRFYTALQLRDLCNELPMWQVAAKYNVARGSVQTLSQACQGFAAGVVKFCKHMHWDALAALLDHVTERLAAGARADLLELAQIPFVKSRTARLLWENGYRNLGALAEADVEEITQVLLIATPKKRRGFGAEEQGYLLMVKEKAEIIVAAAGRLWRRQVEMEAAVEADF